MGKIEAATKVFGCVLYKSATIELDLMIVASPARNANCATIGKRGVVYKGAPFEFGRTIFKVKIVRRDRTALQLGNIVPKSAVFKKK